MEALDRMEKRLGFAGQPRAVSFHIDQATGEKHLHVAWFRVDLETMRAIDPGMYKNHLKELSRRLEKEFALREVSNTRQPHDRARAAGRNELEESRRLGTDVREIRTAILDSFEQSDGGKAFKAALEGGGFVLANGDRRDCFVVIDPAGGQHALNKKLTGLTLAETRARLGDLDRSQLPNVDRAKEMQAERQAAREAQEREKHGPEAGGQGRDASGPQRGAQPEIKPLGQTAGDMRMAWSLSRDADQLIEALAMRGIGIARVTAEEAYESQRKNAFAKEIGNRAPVYREGEIVAVNGFEQVYRFNERTTGQLRDEIEKRLGGIDPAELMSVADTKETMREAARATNAEARERARPATALEQRIIDCVQRAWQDGFAAERDGETVHLTGAGAVAAALDQAGISVVRVTQADEIAIAALRHDEEMARLAAETNREARRANRFDNVKAGEIAAVDRFGNVHRLNPYTLELENLEATLIEAGNARLPSVTEARATFEEARERTAERREETAEVWREINAENARRRGDGTEGPSRDSGKDEGVRSGGDIGDRILSGVTELVSKIFDWLVPPPKLTPEQAKQEARAEEAERQQREIARSKAEWEARLAERLEEDARRRRRPREAGQDYDRDDDRGRPREAGQDYDRDDDRGRERDRS